MKEKLLMAFVLAALLLTTASAAAEEIDSVILTTTNHYPDSIVAAVTANKIGAPVLLTSPGELDSETLAEIEELSPDTIYIVGGPAAISEDVEATLAESYEVVRIWGVTRFGTTAALAEYFWETAPKVVLVWDVLGLAKEGEYDLLSTVKDLAIQEDLPVLLTKKNELPESVVDALFNLSVESVILVGNVGSGVTDALEELGIEVEEHIKGVDDEDTEDEVRERVKDKVRTRSERPLVVVAIGDWSDSIKAPYQPNGTSRHITSEAQIADLISEIEEMNYSRIKIVGKPELAQTVYDRLTEAGIDAELISARKAAAVAVEIAKKNIDKIKERQEAIREKIQAMFQNRVEGLQTDMDNLVERTKNFIENANLNESVKDRWANWVDEKKQSFDDNMAEGSYASAWADYAAIKAKITDITFKYRTRLVEAYQELKAKETTLRIAVANRLSQLKNLRERVALALEA
ncbi:MAG: cell wall-binding repeat-containing protein [Candidatus Aenigmarchaeota archaeon]|nr:cell wall-binding repeat-containing protein [Candidatus Aenigmarchaeota archaeon]